MKIKIANKILSVALATSMVLTSFVPSYAMEEPVDEGTPIEFLDENEEEEEEEESAAAASSSVEVKEETPLNTGAGDDEDDLENGDGTGGPKVTGEDDILILDEEEKEEEGTDSQKTPSVIKIKYELGEDAQLAEADKEKTSLEGFVGEEMTITLAEPVCDGQIFDGWYTTPEYTDNSFTYADGAWTYSFTPEEEEVSLTFYASFGFGSKLMGTDSLNGVALPMAFEVEEGNGGDFYDLTREEKHVINYGDGTGFMPENDLYYIQSYYTPGDMMDSAVPKNKTRGVIIPKPGYKLEGIYFSNEFTEENRLKAEKSTHESDIWWCYDEYLVDYSDLPEDFREALENGNLPKLYLNWEPIELRIVVDAFGNEELLSDVSLQNGEYFPDLGEAYRDSFGVELGRAGYSVNGWYYYRDSWQKTNITAGKTKLILGVRVDDLPNYHYSLDNNCYFFNVYPSLSQKKYTVNYHINNYNGDIKVSKTYTTSNGYKPLDITKGDVSGNSSFDKNNDVFLGWTTKEGEFFACDDVNQPTVMDIIEYADENGLTTIDLYGQWDDTNHTYTVTFDTGLKNIASENFEGSEFDVPEVDPEAAPESAERVQHTEIVSVGETVILSGKEYVREGYTLTGWTYASGNKTVTLKPTASFKDIASADEEITLTAVWKADTYTITYNLNGGKAASKVSKVSYTKERVPDKTALLNYSYISEQFEVNDQVTRTGYTFAGWKAADKSYSYYGGDIYENLTLVAQWEPIVYYVILDGNSGTTKMYDSQGNIQNYSSVLFEMTYDKAENLKSYVFSRDGYKFKNFTATIDGKTKTYAANASIKNLTSTPNDRENPIVLQAQWTDINYSITYALGGGKLPKGKKNAVKYKPSTGLANIVSPEKPGYIFTGWTLTQKGVDEPTATVTPEVGVDECVSSAITAGSYGNIVLTANWKEKEYTVLFAASPESGSYNEANPGDWNDYTGKTFSETVSFSEAAKLIERIEKDNAEHDGQSIKGFSTSSDLAKKRVTYSLSANYSVSKFAWGADNTTTLYPIWGTKTYHITYTGLEGATLSKYTYTYSVSAKSDQALPTASKKGYTFKGWEELDDDGNPIDVNASVLTVDGKKIKKNTAQDITLRAKLVANTYKVMYSPNAKDVILGANGPTVPNKAVQLGDENVSYEGDDELFDTLPNGVDQDAPVWERTGYTFRGFATSARSTTAITSLAGLTTGKSITLYAIWEANKYDINYMNVAKVTNSEKAIMLYNPNNLVNPNVAYARQQTYGKVYKPEKASAFGFTFLGWELVDADGNPIQSSAVTLSKGYVTSVKATNTSELYLKPVFSEFTYKIVFNANGGTYDDNGKTIKTKTFAGIVGTTDLISTGLPGGDSLSDFVSAERSGYKLRCLSLDKAGKNVVVKADGTIISNAYYLDEGNNKHYILRALTNKNNGSVTIYAIWDKVTPSKPTGVTASIQGDNLQVYVGEASSADAAYEIQYSSSMFFTGANTIKVNYGYNSVMNVHLYNNSKCYVRVRKLMKDSMGNDISGAWSNTVRASKAVSN